MVGGGFSAVQSANHKPYKRVRTQAYPTTFVSTLSSTKSTARSSTSYGPVAAASRSVGDPQSFVSVDLTSSWPSVALPDSAMEKAWEKDVREETDLSGEAAAGLIRPAGTSDLPVILRLHYPTFRTRFADFGKVDDVFNPCTNLLLKNGFNGSNSVRQAPPCYSRVSSTKPLD